ncbi:MAG: hypothetical protein J0H92_02640 [Sphingobacteriales bacterium]|jgi:hypothetical protein|nr:hypothetical protein [Sphingobacteriales bacterium]
MKRPFYCVLLLLQLSGCKKTIEHIQEQKILDIMVNGQWVVTKFTLNGTDMTPSFSSYRFQYYRNMTVDAIHNGTTETTGQWDGDIGTRSTWALFANAAPPVSYLNGTWQITNNTLTYVILIQADASNNKFMRLDKL